jgi:hypothetical protein
VSTDPIQSPAAVDWPAYAPDEILPGLFQGGTQDDDVVWLPAQRRLRDGFPFDLVVTLYADANPAPWGVQETRYGFYDADLADHDAHRVIAIARQAHQAWTSGERVLVRCQAGVNRSGLVSALVLMIQGYSPEEAIELLRSRRGRQVLCNAHFEQWLLTQATQWLAQSSDPLAA